MVVVVDDILDLILRKHLAIIDPEIAVVILVVGWWRNDRKLIVRLGDGRSIGDSGLIAWKKKKRKPRR